MHYGCDVLLRTPIRRVAPNRGPPPQQRPRGSRATGALGRISVRTSQHLVTGTSTRPSCSWLNLSGSTCSLGPFGVHLHGIFREKISSSRYVRSKLEHFEDFLVRITSILSSPAKWVCLHSGFACIVLYRRYSIPEVNRNGDISL